MVTAMMHPAHGAWSRVVADSTFPPNITPTGTTKPHNFPRAAGDSRHSLRPMRSIKYTYFASFLLGALIALLCAASARSFASNPGPLTTASASVPPPPSRSLMAR